MITRWIFSPLEMVPSPVEGNEPYELPVCRQYCAGNGNWLAPWHQDGFALVRCEMDAAHFAAAQKDSRLIICESVNDPAPIHDKIADHHAEHGAKRGHTLKQLLKQMEARHVAFMLDD